ISDRRSDAAALLGFIYALKSSKARAFGYNNLAFDYPIVHWFATQLVPSLVTAQALFAKAQEVIRNQDDEGAFSSFVKERDWLFEQVDLFKIHHFDNRAKRTGLKALQFAMNSDSIEDLPFAVGQIL